MTTQAERLALLTNGENLPIVMEILKEGDNIRSLLFNQFMEGLKNYLQEQTTTPQDECELSVINETDDCRSGVYLWKSTLPREKQYLRYCVEHTADFKGCQLTLGFKWADNDIWNKPGVQELKCVVQLGERLKASGLRKGSQSWFRWRYIRQENSTDEFLIAMIDEEERNSLFRQVNDCFWPLVPSTFKMLAAANEEIAKVLER